MSWTMELEWPPTGGWPSSQTGSLSAPGLSFAAMLGAAAAASCAVHLTLTRGMPTTCVGEVAAGVVLGPAYFALVPAEHVSGELLVHFGRFGVCLSLFEAGMCLDFRLLRGRLPAVCVWALAASLVPSVLAFVVLDRFVGLDRADSVVNAIALLPACSRFTKSLTAAVRMRRNGMDQTHDTILAVAFCADVIALHGFVIVHSLQVNADRDVPSHPSAKGNHAANVAGEWWPSVQGVLVSIFMLNLTFILRKIAACSRAPTTSGASSQQVASGNDVGKSTDAHQLHLNGGYFGSPRPSADEERRKWRERNAKWDFSSGEDDDDGKWQWAAEAHKQTEFMGPHARQPSSSDSEEITTDNEDRDRERAPLGRQAWVDRVGAGTRERWESNLQHWKDEIKGGSEVDASTETLLFVDSPSAKRAGRLLRELDHILLRESEQEDVRTQAQVRRAHASIAGASKCVDGELDISRANAKLGLKVHRARSESAQGKKHFNQAGVPADLKMGDLCGVSSSPDGPIHPEELDSRKTSRQEMQSERKADECLQDSKCFCTLSWCTIASMPKVLSEALCLWCVLATLLACMVIVEFFGSSYTLGALFAGAVIGASDQVAHFWRTRSGKMMVWALRVFYLTFSATIAKTPWRERWIVASAACLSLADVISRLIIAFCMTFSQWPRLSIGTPVCHNSRFQATLLGASGWGRDEVSLWMLASFFAAGQVSAEGFAIVTWAVMLSSFFGPSVLIMLLEVLGTSQREDTQDRCKGIFGPGIVWASQSDGSHKTRGGQNQDAAFSLSVAGFLPGSCAPDKGVALGDVLVAFRDHDTDAIVGVGSFVAGEILHQNMNGSTAEEYSIHLIQEKMMGAKGSVCELHLYRQSDYATFAQEGCAVKTFGNLDEGRDSAALVRADHCSTEIGIKARGWICSHGCGFAAQDYDVVAAHEQTAHPLLAHVSSVDSPGLPEGRSSQCLAQDSAAHDKSVQERDFGTQIGAGVYESITSRSTAYGSVRSNTTIIASPRAPSLPGKHADEPQVQHYEPTHSHSSARASSVHATPRRSTTSPLAAIESGPSHTLGFRRGKRVVVMVPRMCDSPGLVQRT